MTSDSEEIEHTTTNLTVDPQLVESNIQALSEGSELIRLLKGDQYVQGFKPAFSSTIGAHFRHVLEHYRCFNSQIVDRSFCYDKRERDQLLECDSSYALQTIDSLIQALSELALKSEKDADMVQGDFTIADEQTSSKISTTINRELLFLQAHTVHHYAIIGAMTRAFGNQPDEDFGVAIATRVHNETCAETATPTMSTKGATCAQ